MRRKDRQISEKEALHILENGEYGILSTLSPESEPYGVPLNYCLIDHAIYFHCALEGMKLNNVATNPKVSFCVVGGTEILPGEFSTKFESCIIQGHAGETFAQEKQTALEGLIKKYSGQFMAEGFSYIGKAKDKVRVFKIEIQSISGKARK